MSDSEHSVQNSVGTALIKRNAGRKFSHLTRRSDDANHCDSDSKMLETRAVVAIVKTARLETLSCSGIGTWIRRSTKISGAPTSTIADCRQALPGIPSNCREVADPARSLKTRDCNEQTGAAGVGMCS